MCNSETAWKLDELTCKLTCLVEDEAAKGLAFVETEEMGHVVDMIKDLSEAKYYCTVVTAMLEEDERMGYNPRRYSDGRYAPKGRGTMGYPEMMMDGPMGYPMRGRGETYEKYRTARMGYQQQSTAENRRAMEQAADEHLVDMEESMREMWADADQKQKTKMKSALVNLVNDLK